MTPTVEAAYRAWRQAAEKGYGERCTTPNAMAKVDARIRRLRAKYERLLAESKAQEATL